MATYDTTAEADPFARSRIGFEALVEDLAGGRTGQMTHDQLEELVEDRGRELKRQLLQDHLDLRAAREEQALPAGGEARRVAGRERVGRGHERGLATGCGPKDCGLPPAGPPRANGGAGACFAPGWPRARNRAASGWPP